MDTRETLGTAYRGTWKAGMVYTRGQFVTHQGSLWHCEGDTVNSKPPSKDWKLAVKSGSASEPQQQTQAAQLRYEDTAPPLMSLRDITDLLHARAQRAAHKAGIAAAAAALGGKQSLPEVRKAVERAVKAVVNDANTAYQERLRLAEEFADAADAAKAAGNDDDAAFDAALAVLPLDVLEVMCQHLEARGSKYLHSSDVWNFLMTAEADAA